ncbi:MAG: hypothetical protein DRI56_12785 [Chloroflexota bacterium]|nr:MAG: hypothetical protein DRI56_12785 [Chloroflexota bacterium]
MVLEKSRIQALCFDVDGTLSDTDDQFVENLTSTLSLVGFLFPKRDARPFARKVVMVTETPANVFYGLPDKLGIDDEISALGDFFYRLGLGGTPKPFKLIPGVKEMLAALFERYPLAVVSARGGKSTRRFLEQFQLTDFFQCIVTAQTCAHTKPYPDPVEWAAKEMGVAPENCLMIGDTTVDIKAARAAGAQSVGVLCGFGEEAELREAGADVILADTSQLLGVL